MPKSIRVRITRTIRVRTQVRTTLVQGYRVGPVLSGYYLSDDEAPQLEAPREEDREGDADSVADS